MVDLKRGNTLDSLDLDFLPDDYFKQMGRDNKRPRLDEVEEKCTLTSLLHINAFFILAGYMRIPEYLLKFVAPERLTRPNSGKRLILWRIFWLSRR